MSTANYPHGGQGFDDPRRPPARRRTVERRNVHVREQLVERVLAEFREMPCLRLTPPQAERLFGLRPDISTRVINALIAQGHLRQDEDGRYASALVS